MDQGNPQEQQQVMLGSTKRKPLEEVNQIQDENYCTNHHRTSMHDEQEINKLYNEISYLNSQLNYLYIAPFRHHQGSTHQHLTELCEITNALLARTDKIKDYKNDKARAEAENKRLRDQSERLNYIISDLQRTKGELKANLELARKESKALLDKAQKEKQSLAKDLASYHNKQEYVKHDLKKRDDKFQLIQSRLEKMADKNDKKDFKNNFDLFQPLLKNSQDLTTIQREAEAMILKSIGRQSELLEAENKQLKQCLKELFIRLTKIYDNNIQDASKKVSLQTFVSFLQMPIEASCGVANTLNHLLDRIERELAQRSNFTAFVHDSNVDPSNLLKAIDKMKFYCSQAQTLDQKRSSFTSQLFSIFDRKQKLNHAVLQKMNNSLKSSHESYRSNLTSTEQLLTQQERQRNQYTVFLSNQISLMAQESQVMDILRRDMEHLFDNNSEAEQLLS